MEEKDSSSNGKRFRGNDSEPQGSLKRMKASSVQTFEVVDLEEMQAQMCPNEKVRGDFQSAIDAKLRPDAGSRVCESKPSQCRSPINVRRKWSNDQEICLMNAILETRKPNGDVDWKDFYELARVQLRDQVSNHKLYEKMKNMNKKFRFMVKERKEGKLTTQTPHQQTMYLLWAKHWGTFDSEIASPGKKETESSRPHEMDAENSTENPSSPRENPLNPDSAKCLENRENGDIHTSFAEASEFRENSAVNAANVDSLENPNFAGSPTIRENKDKQFLQEETYRENTNPDFTASPNHMENKIERSVREETQGEKTHLPDESMHQEEETCMENARANGHSVDKPPHREIHVENGREIGHVVHCSGVEQIQFRGLESRIETLIENTIKDIETRLEASIQKSLEESIQNSASRVVTAAVTAAASVSVAAVFYICTYLISRGTS